MASSFLSIHKPIIIRMAEIRMTINIIPVKKTWFKDSWQNFNRFLIFSICKHPIFINQAKYELYENFIG